jgi:hypothetical protein
MARRRSPVEPDADRLATLKEAETMVGLTTYMFRAADPPLTKETDLTEQAMRELIADNPEHPVARTAAFHLDVAQTIREEAMRDD